MEYQEIYFQSNLQIHHKSFSGLATANIDGINNIAINIFFIIYLTVPDLESRLP